MSKKEDYSPVMSGKTMIVAFLGGAAAWGLWEYALAPGTAFALAFGTLLASCIHLEKQVQSLREKLDRLRDSID